MKEKIIKKLLYKSIVIFSIFMIVNNIISIKSYSSSSDFTYTISDETAVITGYNGSEEKLTIPSTIDGYQVKKIEIHAFDTARNSNAIQITELIISEGIREIESFAFMDCKNLRSVKLPESLTSLADFAFIGCENLKEVNIPKNIHKISHYTFNQTGLENFIVPENVNFIGGGTFRSCKNLKSVKVYSMNVEYEGDDIFEYCNSNLILYGYKNSTTQQYATAHKIAFKEMSLEEDDEIPVSEIKLRDRFIELNVGESKTVPVTIIPDNATNKKINWQSSNTSVVTVQNGIVKAINPGIATITVLTVDGNKQAICEITVRESAPKNEIEDKIENQTTNIIKETDKLGSKETVNRTQNQIINNNKLDNTVVTYSRLPYAGERNIVIVMIIVTIISIIFYKKYKYYNCG